MKIATIKCKWKRSPTSDVVRVDLVLTINGDETVTQLGPDVEDFVLEAVANSSYTFRIDTFDSDDQKTSSQTHSRTIGDLELPLPATDLTSEIIAVRDDAEPLPTIMKAATPKPAASPTT
jgi:hypothetical protein